MAVKGEIDALRELDLSEDNDVVEVANQQDRIGWHLVKFGIVTITWYRVQEKWIHRTSNNTDRAKPKQWTKTLQDALWAYVMEVWDHRNKTVHGDTDGDVRNKKTERLCRECASLAAQDSPVGEADKHLLTVRLDDKGSMFLHHWRRLMRNTIKKEMVRRKGQVWRQAEELF